LSFDSDDMSHVETNGFSEPAGDGWTVKTNDKKNSETLCKYFQKVSRTFHSHQRSHHTNIKKGFCRFGNKCKFQHVPNNILNSDAHNPPIDRSNISSVLPTHPVPGFIPLNKDKQRLDIFIPPPTQEAWVVYNARFHRQKPCNDHFLQGLCSKLNCPYDHSPLEPQAQYCLEYVVKCSPCPRRGACRSAGCFYGHICQKNECTGQMKGCRMKAEQHNIDPILASMVPVEEEMLEHDELSGHMGRQGAGDLVASW
jgi:hypothetical protein